MIFGGDIYYISNSFPGVATSVELEGGSLAVSGDFSVGLYLNSSISQTGTVPGNAESLEFEAYAPGANGLGGSDLTVSLGGKSLPIVSEGGELHGVNIPAGMDGQVETLIFGCQGIGSGNVLLDNIEFSTSSVPEPGEFGAIGVGVVLFGVFRLHARLRREMGGGAVEF
ncbi:MAG TPA: hypothetical protein VGY56_01220 [Verrucomicrobiae bacterium]|nr:hypothetical protein [Verrucomicrobiae bacterium]